MTHLKKFKEFLTEGKPLARTVARGQRAKTSDKHSIGFLHFKHGSDFEVLAPDSHDLAYFGKNIVRLKGMTTGKVQAAYVDWAKGTVSFYSGNPDNDMDFDKPEKFKAATLYEEAEENLDLYNQLAEDFEIEIPMDEALVKGKVYKLPSNDMRLLYTGRSKTKASGEYAVFTVVDASGKPRLVSGKKFTQEYKGDMVSKLVLAESEEINEAVVGKSSPNVKKLVAALKKKFDVYVEVEKKKFYNEKTESFEYETVVSVEYYEKGEDSEPIGVFRTSDDQKFTFGHIYSKAGSDHGKAFDVAHIVSGIKTGHYDPK